MIEFQQIIFLSIVQGITEFLPISSSAHLIFIPKIFNWNDQGILFDIAMHFGSLLAILFYYIKHQKDFIDSNTSKNYLSVNKLIIGSIPVLLFGFIFYDYIKINLRSVEVIGITTIIFQGLRVSSYGATVTDKRAASHGLVVDGKLCLVAWCMPLLVYDPQANTWTEQALPPSLAARLACVHDGRLVMFQEDGTVDARGTDGYWFPYTHVEPQSRWNYKSVSGSVLLG